jgi:hypothetical protein
VLIFLDLKLELLGLSESGLLGLLDPIILIKDYPKILAIGVPLAPQKSK